MDILPPFATARRMRRSGTGWMVHVGFGLHESGGSRNEAKAGRMTPYSSSCLNSGGRPLEPPAFDGV